MDELADGDPLKYDAICEMPAGVIYTKLLRSKVKNEIGKAYNEIVNRPKPKTT